MKRIVIVVISALLMLGFNSCGSSKKSSCDCPKNLHEKSKPPKAHKSNIYRK